MPEPHPGGSRSALTFPVQRPGQMRVVPLVAAGAVLEGARPGRQQGRRGEPQSCKDKRAAVTARPARAAPGTGGTGPAAAYRERRAGRAAASSVPGRAGPGQHGGTAAGREQRAAGRAARRAARCAVRRAARRARPPRRGAGRAARPGRQGRDGEGRGQRGGRPVPLPHGAGSAPDRVPGLEWLRLECRPGCGVPPPLRRSITPRTAKMLSYLSAFPRVSAVHSALLLSAQGTTRRGWVCLMCSLSGVCTQQQDAQTHLQRTKGLPPHRANTAGNTELLCYHSLLFRPFFPPNLPFQRTMARYPGTFS